MNTFLAAAGFGSWLDTTFANFDLQVFRFFGNLQNDFLTGLAKVFTALGDEVYVILLAIAAIILLFFKRSRKYGFALIFAVIIGTLLTNILIKPMVMRIRPYNTLQSIQDYFGWYVNAGMLAESDFSFPSGHTTAATYIAVVLCMCTASDKKKRISWLFPIVALLVGCSRVYLMVHYATDVIAGFIIGIIAGIAGYYLSRLVTGKINATNFGQKADAGRLFRRKGRRSPALAWAAVIVFAWCVVFLASFLHMAREGGDSLRCSYNGDYKCYNEAADSDKYPPVNGQYYCKIHWKELNP